MKLRATAFDVVDEVLRATQREMHWTEVVAEARRRGLGSHLRDTSLHTALRDASCHPSKPWYRPLPFAVESTAAGSCLIPPSGRPKCRATTRIWLPSFTCSPACTASV